MNADVAITIAFVAEVVLWALLWGELVTRKIDEARAPALTGCDDDRGGALAPRGRTDNVYRRASALPGADRSRRGGVRQ